MDLEILVAKGYIVGFRNRCLFSSNGQESVAEVLAVEEKQMYCKWWVRIKSSNNQPCDFFMFGK